MTKYNINNMLKDFSEGKEFFLDFEYRERIAYTDILKLTETMSPNKKSEYGYIIDDYQGSGKPLDIDPQNIYINNSYGYRSPEFEKVDLIFSGCSLTYGLGVPEQYIWGVQVANSLGMTYANLGGPGQSVYFAVQNILAYIKKFGSPKVILMNLPNLSRMLVPNNPAVARIDKYKSADKLSGEHVLSGISTNNWDSTETLDLSWRPKYQKFPLNLEDVLYPEFAYYYNLQHILMLEALCDLTNTKLVWGTWNKENSKLYPYLHEQRPEYYNNYIHLEPLIPEDFQQLSACKEHDHLKEQYEYCFDFGSDLLLKVDRSVTYRHAGVHHQTHWAETFLENLHI